MESLSSVIVVPELHPASFNNFNLRPNFHWDTTQQGKYSKGFIINTLCDRYFFITNLLCPSWTITQN